MAGQPAALRRYWANRRSKKRTRRRSSVSHSRRHTRAKMTISLATIAGLAMAAKNIWPLIKAKNYNLAIYRLIPYDITNKKFTTAKLNEGLYPILGGLAVSWAAKKFGINRMLSRMKIPVVRI